MNSVFQIEPERFVLFHRAFVNRSPVNVPEGHGIVQHILVSSTGFGGCGAPQVTVLLWNKEPRALPAWMKKTRTVFALCGRPAILEGEPTEAMKRHADGRYNGVACTCAYDCETVCKGECGCDACADAYGETLELNDIGQPD